MLLSERVYCVAVTFKMVERVEQWICIRFHMKLEHSSTETIQLIQKATAMGNWWLAASSWPQAHSCIVLCSFFCETSNRPGDSAPLLPRFGARRLLAFPKIKITFEREEIFLDHWWDSGTYHGAADGDWENCVRSQGAYFEGDWGITVLWTMFLVNCIFFKKCLYFSYYMAGYLQDRPRMSPITKV